MSLKTGSRWSNWAWDKPVKAFIWRSSRICRPIGGLPPWFFEDSLPHLLLRNNSNHAQVKRMTDQVGRLLAEQNGIPPAAQECAPPARDLIIQVDGGHIPIQEKDQRSFEALA